MPIAVTGLLLLFASVIQIEAVDLKCAEIANKTYQIAFYFSGHFFKENFTGTPIDLGRLYNIRLREAKGTFSVQAARLLLGYDGEVIALPYSVGKVEIEKRKENSRATFSPASSDLKVKIEKWFRANRNEVKLTSGGNNVDFGTLDPASVTLFHDIIFTGDRNIDTTTGKEAENMNLRIKYSSGNHFDISNETSVAGEGGSKTLIGVVNGNKIYREKCDREPSLFYENTKLLRVRGKANCFSME
ncbi:hypothetical protein L596_016943 [Steinernema carpocapsae]|uniref:Auto-transporter adhesin head GIN domain-containing protein n=1 Tax=Steinernema carpocapsae TaxID=34508 RepID=A0A4U5N087_STECR|nr:hypothetical protein L596_016943 [Steinernema carpocapsae]